MSAVVDDFCLLFIKEKLRAPAARAETVLLCALPGRFSFYLDIKRNKTSSQSDIPSALLHFYTSSKSKAFFKGKSKLLLRSLTK